MVATETHDPAAEKRVVAERLRLRSSEHHKELAGGSNPESPPLELQNGQSDSELFRFDDDCLQRLTRALNSLETYALPCEDDMATPADHGIAGDIRLNHR